MAIWLIQISWRESFERAASWQAESNPPHTHSRISSGFDFERQSCSYRYRLETSDDRMSYSGFTRTTLLIKVISTPSSRFSALIRVGTALSIPYTCIYGIRTHSGCFRWELDAFPDLSDQFKNAFFAAVLSVAASKTSVRLE